MAEHDGTKLLMLRVHNSTRSCVLMKKFKDSDIWTMPVISMPYKADPMNYIHYVLKQVATDDKFRVISAVSMIDYCHPEEKDGKTIEHHSIIYDLRYAGKVLPALTKQDDYKYDTSKWVQKGMLDQYIDKCNYPLYAYIKAVGKEECLR